MITPTFADCRELVDAGADIIAIETTGRKRPNNEDVKELVDRVRNELNVPVMADCHDMEDALRTNADIIAPTLSCVGGEEDYMPPWALLERMVKEQSRPVIAEGHFWEPACVTRGFEIGVHAIVIGSAITRPWMITERFVQFSPQGKAKKS